MMTSRIVILAALISVLLSLLSGLNQILGFFSTVSVPTALLSLALAVIIAFVVPRYLREKRTDTELLTGAGSRALPYVLGAMILAAGVGPLLGKLWFATQAKDEGARFVDLHRYGPARVHLTRASTYFDDIGLNQLATESQLLLLQSYAGLGDWGRAGDFIAQLDKSEYLNASMQGKLYTIRGNLAYDRGEFEQAERFYQIAHQTIEPETQAQAALLQNQGVLWSGKGASYEARAVQNFNEARRIYEALDDQIGLAQLLINEGNLYENEPRAARSHYEEALTIATGLDDPHLLGTLRMNIGLTYRQQGELDQADSFYQQAILDYEQGADLLGQADVLANLATLEWARGNKELARQNLQASGAYLQSLDPENELVHPRQIARMRAFMGDIYDALGESETAEALYLEALSIYSRHPDPLREANVLLNYAGLQIRLNRVEEARGNLGRARETIDGYGGEAPHQALGVLLNNLGVVHKDSGDWPAALTFFQQAQAVFESLGDPLHYAEARENVGVLLALRRDFQGSEEAFSEALDIYRLSGNKDQQAKTLFNLYALSGATNQQQAPEMVDEILGLLAQHEIDQETEAGILFGILTQDISSDQQLIAYRERLSQLRLFYEERDEPVGLGRSLIKLAEVEQALGNFSKMMDFARAAEAYADRMPLPLRISFHTDLGFYLLGEDPENAIDHFFEAFDLAGGVDPIEQYNLAKVIETYLYVYSEEIDTEKYLSKVQHILETSADPFILEQFEAIVDVLGS